MIIKIYVVLFVLSCLAVDVKDGRIPNCLIVIFLIPLAARCIYFGLPEGFLDLALPLLLLMSVVWYLGLLGGADVKVFLTLALAVPGPVLFRIFLITLLISLLAFLATRFWKGVWVRSLPMMPFVGMASLVVWLC